LNYALSVADAGGVITILDGGMFGPIIITQSITIEGAKADAAQIAADPVAQVGCIGALPSGCGLTNNGFAVEIAAGATDTVMLDHTLMSAGLNGVGALKLTSGGQVQLSNDVLRGNDSATGPIVALYPNNPGTTQAQVYLFNSDVGFNNGIFANAGAIEVKPSGNTSLNLDFKHVEVHNASYGIRTDSSLLSGPAISVVTAISQSVFFSFANAAVNTLSTSGAGLTNVVFSFVKIYNANVAVMANGPQSIVILSNSTVAGNGTGVRPLNGATIFSSGNNTINGNGTDLTGTITNTPRQ
jgi:hypothetical protein